MCENMGDISSFFFGLYFYGVPTPLSVCLSTQPSVVFFLVLCLLFFMCYKYKVIVRALCIYLSRFYAHTRMFLIGRISSPNGRRAFIEYCQSYHIDNW